MYVPSEKDSKNLDNNFKYHPPKDGQTARDETIRREAKCLSKDYCSSPEPPCKFAVTAGTNHGVSTAYYGTWVPPVLTENAIAVRLDQLVDLLEEVVCILKGE